MNPLAASFPVTTRTARQPRIDGVTMPAPAARRGRFTELVRGGRRLLVDTAEVRPGDVVLASRRPA